MYWWGSSNYSIKYYWIWSVIYCDTSISFILYTWKGKPFATPGYEVFRYSAILVEKQISNDSYKTLMTLEQLVNSTQIDYKFVIEHQSRFSINSLLFPGSLVPFIMFFMFYKFLIYIYLFFIFFNIIKYNK